MQENLKDILEVNVKHITDEEWQTIINKLRNIIPTTTEKRLSRRSGNSQIVGRNWNLSYGCYDGTDTLDKRYCDFINDILKNIRHKSKTIRIDYAYYIYQICDLLRFEPNLQTRLVHNECGDYFEVWFDNNSVTEV